MTRTVFVTGGAGYVGAHCCKAFSEAGWNVVVYDNLSRGWRDFVKWGSLIVGDLLDEAALSRAISHTRPDAVAHFAALAYVGESVENPGMYYRNNVVGTLNLLGAMREHNVRNLVFSSTCATYGPPVRIPIDESHPQDPINPYGRTKLMAEWLLRDFDAAFNLRSVALRYFNAAGADPDGEIGERHEPETHVIPLALRGAGTDSYEFQVFGTDYDTPDGTAIRDYIHVCDLASAHLKALDHLQAGGESAAINLGTGTGTSVLEIRDAVEAVTGRKIRTKLCPRRQGDPSKLVARPDKALEMLGWRAERSDIRTIIEDAWTWHQAEMARAGA
ncbi:MAG: UDP-glucose 4-epimerase GalE [Hyphomonas sp.]|nr:UDP-glucose 4-epimerase GalE [Hyphomonas sp.]MCB9962691.1 UDP-glucose 4-epimerase GalE [Hyphomonas sp.]MCB9970009.1 UDP-glucose 4-epimerase GalE [Hyphomonas sp.]